MKKLEQSTRIRLGKHLPKSFYKQLVKVTSEKGQEKNLPYPSKTLAPDGKTVVHSSLDFYNQHTHTPLQVLQTRCLDPIPQPNPNQDCV